MATRPTVTGKSKRIGKSGDDIFIPRVENGDAVPKKRGRRPSHTEHWTKVTVVLAEPKGDGRPIVVVKQIVGLIARRIIFTAKEGDFLRRGDRIGRRRLIDVTMRRTRPWPLASGWRSASSSSSRSGSRCGRTSPPRTSSAERSSSQAQAKLKQIARIEQERVEAPRGVTTRTSNTLPPTQPPPPDQQQDPHEIPRRDPDARRQGPRADLLLRRVRHRGRRVGARAQPVRPAERAGGQGQHRARARREISRAAAGAGLGRHADAIAHRRLTPS